MAIRERAFIAGDGFAAAAFPLAILPNRRSNWKRRKTARACRLQGRIDAVRGFNETYAVPRKPAGAKDDLHPPQALRHPRAEPKHILFVIALIDR
jgi:hypothetical protein